MSEPDANGSLLRFEDVHKSYGDEHVLRGISFGMDRGDVEVVIGPSGSGKSTMLRCVNRLTEIDEGAGKVRGRGGVGVRGRAVHEPPGGAEHEGCV
jgi:ABC-type polar amino acid transport system ATPase subunit